jgi:hypothetical protein
MVDAIVQRSEVLELLANAVRPRGQLRAGAGLRVATGRLDSDVMQVRSDLWSYISNLFTSAAETAVDLRKVSRLAQGGARCGHSYSAGAAPRGMGLLVNPASPWAGRSATLPRSIPDASSSIVLRGLIAERVRLGRRSHRPGRFSVRRVHRDLGSPLAGGCSAAPAVARPTVQTPLGQLARPTPHTP